METYKNITEATAAAELFFNENFGHTLGVGIETKCNHIIEYYSKQDPAMEDTFTCIVEQYEF